MGFALVALAAVSFSAVGYFAWTGHLGFAALGSLLFAAVTYFLGRRKLEAKVRKPLDMISKIAFTIVGVMA